MVKGKAIRNSGEVKKSRPALSPEARENQMISLAMDLAEKQLRNGTASSQIITEFVKRGSTKERIEKEILEQQKDLVKAKTDALQSTQRMEELYADALNAMKKYRSQSDSYDDY